MSDTNKRYELSADEKLRIQALESAVRTAVAGDSMYEVKDRAREYYDFLSDS